MTAVAQTTLATLTIRSATQFPRGGGFVGTQFPRGGGFVSTQFPRGGGFF